MYKMDLALNNIQQLICQSEPNLFFKLPLRSKFVGTLFQTIYVSDRGVINIVVGNG